MQISLSEASAERRIREFWGWALRVDFASSRDRYSACDAVGNAVPFVTMTTAGIAYARAAAAIQGLRMAVNASIIASPGQSDALMTLPSTSFRHAGSSHPPT